MLNGAGSMICEMLRVRVDMRLRYACLKQPATRGLATKRPKYLPDAPCTVGSDLTLLRSTASFCSRDTSLLWYQSVGQGKEWLAVEAAV